MINVRFTAGEAEQLKTQAAARRMNMGSYLRSLALADGEALVAEGKIRRGSDGCWEIFAMGSWQRSE